MTDKEQLDAFKEAMETIKSQQKQLEDLTSPVYPTGTVLAVTEKTAMVEVGAAIFECERPNGTDKSWVGATVDIHPKTGQIVRRSNYVRYGVTATVQQVEGKLVFLTTPYGTLVTPNSAVDIETLQPGDHVVMNHTNNVILAKAEIKSKQAYVTQKPLNWDDIGGCVKAKKELQAALELPYTHAKVYEFFKKKRIKGGVLWGRPGMGKTLLGRACAGSIVRTHSAAPESFATSFIYVKGPELLVKWVGDTEEAIRNLFEHARTHFKKWGYPAVIFIDEADALLTRRGVKTAAGMEQTVVPQFNAEMDGLEDSGAFVLLATNRLDILDPAIIRPGRCDRKFHVEPPTRENAPEYLEIHMRELPVARPATAQDLIQSAVAAWFGDKYPLYKLETDKGERVFTLANLASGAMMAGLVERATAHAIDRNLEAAEPDGLTAADFDAALADIHAEEFGVSHFDELREYIETERLELKNIVPCRNDADKAAPMPKSQSSMTLAIAVPVGGGQGTVKEVPEGDDKKKDWTN